MAENNLLLLGFSYTIGIMSPGPSLAVITKNSLYFSSRMGVYTAIGTVTGIAFQALYVLAGLNFLQGNSNFVDYLNIALGSYLIYLGIKSLVIQYRNSVFLKSSSQPEGYTQSISNWDEIQEDMKPSKLQAFREGFLIDALNPIALTFFMVIFPLYISQGADLSIKVMTWVEIILLGSLWFIGFSLLISRAKVRNLLLKAGKFLAIAMSLIFFYLGGKLLIQATANQYLRFIS